MGGSVNTSIMKQILIKINDFSIFWRNFVYVDGKELVGFAAIKGRFGRFRRCIAPSPSV